MGYIYITQMFYTWVNPPQLGNRLDPNSDSVIPLLLIHFYGNSGFTFLPRVVAPGQVLERVVETEPPGDGHSSFETGPQMVRERERGSLRGMGRGWR